jgi:hypothetical protein
MYLQTTMEPSAASIKMKIEERLRNLALKKYMNIGSNYDMTELTEELRDMDAISPTEFRAVRYLLDIYDKVLHACRVDPDRIKEANEIGERLIHIIDKRLETE